MDAWTDAHTDRRMDEKWSQQLILSIAQVSYKNYSKVHPFLSMGENYVKQNREKDNIFAKSTEGSFNSVKSFFFIIFFLV